MGEKRMEVGSHNFHTVVAPTCMHYIHGSKQPWLIVHRVQIPAAVSDIIDVCQKCGSRRERPNVKN